MLYYRGHKEAIISYNSRVREIMDYHLQEDVIITMLLLVKITLVLHKDN